MVRQHHENVISNLEMGVRFYESVVETNGYVPFHWHSSIELIYVMSGQFIFKFDGEAHVVQAQQFIVIPSGVVHDVTSTANKALVLQIPLDFMAQYCDDPANLNMILKAPTDESYQKVVGLLNELNQINMRQKAGYLFDFGIILLMILKTVVLKFGTAESTKIRQDTSGLKDIITEINRHYTEPLRVSQLARKFGYNPSYLSRLFKQQIGITIVEYLYELRLSELYQDLIKTTLPIKGLMQKHGLTNERTAREMFKKMYGDLPKQVRLKYHR